MGDIQTTFTERFLKVQVQADQPRRAPPPPPPPRDTADALFMGSAPAAPPPAALNTSLGRLPSSQGSVPEVGRNDPCPCGSGKKYKKCHGALR